MFHTKYRKSSASPKGFIYANKEELDEDEKAVAVAGDEDIADESRT